MTNAQRSQVAKGYLLICRAKSSSNTFEENHIDHFLKARIAYTNKQTNKQKINKQKDNENNKQTNKQTNRLKKDLELTVSWYRYRLIDVQCYLASLSSQSREQSECNACVLQQEDSSLCKCGLEELVGIDCHASVDSNIVRSDIAVYTT